MKPGDPVTRERLTEYLGEVYWSDLAAHASRDALILVSEELDLVDAALAVATDDAPRVEAWIASRAFRKPTARELAAWPSDPDASFLSLVVVPFVLARPIRAVPPSAVN